MAVDGRRIGSLVLADTVRDSAPGCVTELRRLGLRVVMITGDGSAAARSVAGEVGIRDVRSDLLPVEKLNAVRAYQAAGSSVAMVGDGVNDSPALAEAAVGVAMGSGTDIAQQAADVVLISEDLADLTRTIHIARRAWRIVMANFVGTVAVDIVGIVLAGVGLIDPVVAALIHVGSESAFILNSARLIPARLAAVAEPAPPPHRTDHRRGRVAHANA